MEKHKLVTLLNSKVDLYNQPSFIAADPVSIPHRFTKKQDIEIAGFFAAIFAWGNRTTIISKTTELLRLMDNKPHDFVLHAGAAELKRLEGFKHRTFNTTDLLYCMEFFKMHYSANNSLESAFSKWMHRQDADVEKALTGFHHYFFSLPYIPERTRKHIATPEKNSSCKRLNMFLRWMVRRDDKGVDFGIWKKIKPSQLICPLDVHVSRVARNTGLLQRQQNDWAAAKELTANLRNLDAADPVKYDFALFGLGVMEKY
ncbi:MAG: TIGR02757 family protein [Ferruginibacter sp.]